MKHAESIYLDTPVSQLLSMKMIDRSVERACQAANPPMLTAGDIVEHLDLYGNFSDVPGCRRPGKILDTLLGIAGITIRENSPSELNPRTRRKAIAVQLDKDADFDFLSDLQREDILEFRREHGHLPMLKILQSYFNRPDASRNDIIMAFALGLQDDSQAEYSSLAEIARQVELSRERVRQITLNYQLPEMLSLSRLWTFYVDYSTYYVDPNHQAFKHACTYEITDLSFSSYADIL